MSQPNAQSQVVPDTAGFDAIYQGDFEAFDRAAGQPASFGLDRVPWDIGEAQPKIVALEAAGEISSEVLDIGCGTGDNALFLAKQGYRVCGLDGAPAAITTARERARTRGVEAEFAVAEATELSGYAGRFATVVDSALYHCLGTDERSAYLAALRGAVRPGAWLHLLCFSDRMPEGFPGPHRISEAELRSTLPAAGWTINRLQLTTYTTAFNQDALRQQAPEGLLEELDAAGIGYDDQGRLLAPVWQVAAQYR